MALEIKLPVSIALGTTIRHLRRVRGMNQQQLAALVGVSQPTISEVERGKAQNTEILEQVAVALALDVYALFRLAEGVARGEMPHVRIMIPDDSQRRRPLPHRTASEPVPSQEEAERLLEAWPEEEAPRAIRTLPTRGRRQ